MSFGVRPQLFNLRFSSFGIQGADDKLGQVSECNLTDVTLREFRGQGVHCMNSFFLTFTYVFTFITAF